MTVSGQFFLTQASSCATSAAGSTLTNQRETYLRAQAAWQALADREFGLKAARAQREADKAEAEADARSGPDHATDDSDADAEFDRHLTA